MHQVDLENSSQKSNLPSGIAWSDPSDLNNRVVQGHKRPLHEGFPKRLRWLRKKAGLTQSALAQMVKWGSTSLLEAGSQKPSIETVEKLAAALGVSPAWLAYGSEAGLPFRQRQARVVLPPDPPEPSPAVREPTGLWKGMHRRLKATRLARGMSLGSVARSAEISPQAVHLAEGGTMALRLGTCELIAEALGIAPGWLAYGDEDGTVGT